LDVYVVGGRELLENFSPGRDNAVVCITMSASSNSLPGQKTIKIVENGFSGGQRLSSSPPPTNYVSHYGTLK
jgi:hypothetical protein